MSRGNPRQGGIRAGPRIGGLLRLAWQRVRERIQREVRARGYADLGAAHLALFRYELLDGQRPTELAEQMQITKQSINDLLGHLERRGYVERRRDPRDSRARMVYLTARGRRLRAVVWAEARAVEEGLEATLGPRRFSEFRETLLMISGATTNGMPDGPPGPGPRPGDGNHPTPANPGAARAALRPRRGLLGDGRQGPPRR